MHPQNTEKNHPPRVGGSIPSRATSSEEGESRDTPGQKSPEPWGFALWQHLLHEHGLTLVESEIQEIVRLAEPLTGAAKLQQEVCASLGQPSPESVPDLVRQLVKVLQNVVGVLDAMSLARPLLAALKASAIQTSLKEAIEEAFPDHDALLLAVFKAQRTHEKGAPGA